MERVTFLQRACGEHGVIEYWWKETSEQVCASHRPCKTESPWSVQGHDIAIFKHKKISFRNIRSGKSHSSLICVFWRFLDCVWIRLLMLHMKLKARLCSFSE